MQGHLPQYFEGGVNNEGEGESYDFGSGGNSLWLLEILHFDDLDIFSQGNTLQDLIEFVDIFLEM